MKKNNRYKIIIIFILTSLVAFLTLIYPIIQKEKSKEDFIVQVNDFKKFENYFLFPLHDKHEAIKIAEDALKNIYRFGSTFKAIDSLENAWKSSCPMMYMRDKDYVYENSTHEYYVQSLGILYDLIIAHQQNKNNLFLEKGFEIINSWAQYNARFCIFQSLMPWNDHVVSDRIIAILLFYDYSKQYMTVELQQNIINKITKDSILYLANEYNYTRKHNHGIFEDIALLMSAGHLADKEQQKFYSRIAMNRLKQQVMETYDKNGVHLENSPKYHLVITDLLNSFTSFAKIYNLTIDTETLNRIKLANKNKYFFVLNNGHVPTVGDSTDRSYSSFERIKDEVLISQDGGYVIFKDKTNYLLIRTQGISNVHAHHDQLSYVYEVDDDLIISDPGFISYTKSRENKFLRSLKAHNTILTNDANKKKIYSFNKTLNTKEFFYCQVVSHDKNIIREFLLDKKLKILLVRDTIENNMENLMEALNLSSEVINIKDGNYSQEINLINKHKYYIGSFQDEDLVNTNILHGSKESFFGWRAITFKGLVPSYTLLTPLVTKKKTFFTRVIADSPIKLFSNNGNDLNISIAGVNKKYDLNHINNQSRSIAYTGLNHSENQLSSIVDRVKNKLKPHFYKRVKIFLFENLIMIFFIILYLVVRRYVLYLLIIPFAAINLFNFIIILMT